MWLRAILAGAVLATGVAGPAVAQCPDGSMPPCVRRAPAPLLLDSNVVAVLPFRVAGPAAEAAWLREGVVDLLSLALDGVGSWRTVAPRVVLRSIGTAGDDDAPRLARRLGAGAVVTGTIIGAGRDLRLRAELLETRSGRRLGGAEARGEPADAGLLVDSIAAGLVRIRLSLGATGVRRPMREYTTSSPPALRAFAVAEMLARAGRWEQAAESLLVAIDRDSSFGLAYYRLLIAWTYGGVARHLTLPQIIDGGLRHGARLPARQRDLLEFLRAMFVGDRIETLRLADNLGEHHAADPEAALEQGEGLYHIGLLSGVSPERALAAFERAIELDPEFPEPYQHAAELRAMLGDTALAWEYVRRNLGLAPGRVPAALAMALDVALRGVPPERVLRAPANVIGSLSFNAQFELLRVLDREPGRALRLADSLAAATMAVPGIAEDDRVQLLVRRHLYHVALGRPEAAWRYLAQAAALAPTHERVFTATVWHHAVHGSRLAEAEAALRRVTGPDLASRRALLEAWTSARLNDSARLERSLSDLTQRAPGDRYLAAIAAGCRGLIALTARDSARARELLTAAWEIRPRRGFWSSTWEPDAFFSIALARLEWAARQPTAAHHRLFDAFLPESPATRIEAEELRARIAEATGDTAAARTSYERLLDAWREAEPALQPRVRAARDALVRLGR